MSLDPVAFKRTKHILRAAEFLRDLVAREVITCAHLPGKIMIADVLTKACSRPIFLDYRDLFMNIHPKVLHALSDLCPLFFVVIGLRDLCPGGAISGQA